MERLTEIQSAGYDLKELNGEWCNKYCEKQKAYTCNKCGIYQAIQKLAEYEDLEEQGLLLRLPVLIGTTVYEFEPLNKIVKGCTARTIVKYTMYDDSIWFNFADGFMKNIEDFGETVFLTREAAEQKLKEIEQKANDDEES